MTLEAYIDGVLSYRISNWIPSHDGEQRGDGRLISGEWLETMVTSEYYQRSGNSWSSHYIVAITIPTALRLDKSHTEIDFSSNPYNIPQPTDPWWYWKGSATGIGPNTTTAYSGHGIRWMMSHDVDNFDSEGTSWRLILRLYFARITHRILRDPTHNNLIVRTSPNGSGKILIDA